MKQTLKYTIQPPLWWVRLIFLAGMAMLLAGCGGVAFSPGTAAVQMVLDRPMSEFTVNRNSIEVLQEAPLNDKVVVMVRFSGVRAGSGEEQCLFTYAVEKTPLGGWGGGSGGGGCSIGNPNPEEVISVSAGMSSGSMINDPGVSEVNGVVYRDDVATVLITWKDGTTQQVDVINKSYLAVREGQFEMDKVEALNADGEVLNNNE